MSRYWTRYFDYFEGRYIPVNRSNSPRIFPAAIFLLFVGPDPPGPRTPHSTTLCLVWECLQRNMAMYIDFDGKMTPLFRYTCSGLTT
jgi:hypothetical protein